MVVVMEHRWKRRWPGQPLDAPQEPVLHATKSVGVAVGVLTAALHNANLATVVTTPDGCDEQASGVADSAPALAWAEGWSGGVMGAGEAVHADGWAGLCIYKRHACCC